MIGGCGQSLEATFSPRSAKRLRASRCGAQSSRWQSDRLCRQSSNIVNPHGSLVVCVTCVQVMVIDTAYTTLECDVLHSLFQPRSEHCIPREGRSTCTQVYRCECQDSQSSWIWTTTRLLCEYAWSLERVEHILVTTIADLRRCVTDGVNLQLVAPSPRCRPQRIKDNVADPLIIAAVRRREHI